MKNLLILIASLALLSGAIWAQNTTNPPGIPSSVSAFSGFPYLSFSTNSITVTGAGTAIVTNGGPYTWWTNMASFTDGGSGVSAPAVAYTNTNHTAIYILDPVRNPAWLIATNDLTAVAAGTQVYYHGDSFDARQFSSAQRSSLWGDTGAAPLPTVAWTGVTVAGSRVTIDPRLALSCPTIAESRMENRNGNSSAWPTNYGSALLYVPSGSGVIRSIKYTSDSYSDKPQTLTNNNIRLQVFTDGGVQTNFNSPNGDKLDLPIRTLLGSRYSSGNSTAADFRNTRWLDVAQQQGTNGHWLVRLKAPIYFGNGALVLITGGISTDKNGYSEITWEPGTLPNAQQAYRLRSSFSSTANNSFSGTVNFMNCSKPGILIALFTSMSSTDSAWPETLWRFGAWASDAEDTFMNPFFFALGKTTQSDWGTTTFSWSNPYTAEAYRMWTANDAPVWVSPVSAEFAEPGGLNYTNETLTLYYSQ